MRRDFLGEWFSVIDLLHHTPRFRWRRRKKLNARLDRIEQEWDAAR